MDINESPLGRTAHVRPTGAALRAWREADLLTAARGVALVTAAGVALYLLLALGVLLAVH